MTHPRLAHQRLAHERLVHERLALAAGPLALELAPAMGGAITRFCSTAGDAPVELMRRTPRGADLPPGVLSCFPLVPVSNRIAFATLRHAGQDYRLPGNFAGEPHYIHGDGWQNPWTVAAATATTATLAFDFAQRDGPYAYAARQHFTLTPDHLRLELAVTHNGKVALPFGLGLHPYFERTADATLTAAVDAVWLNDAQMVPTVRQPVPAPWQFGAGRTLAPLKLDNCFAGWSGTARIDWPDRRTVLAIEADAAFGHLVVFVPPGEAYFCVEPVTNCNNGFNLAAAGRTDTGTVVLGPGETLAGAITFRPSGI